MRHLIASDLTRLLAIGRGIEQFLAPRQADNYRALRWLSIKKDGHQGKFLVTRFEVFDEGDPEHLDIYSFSYVNPDEPFVEHSDISTPEAALLVAREKFGADPERFVNAGVVQDEYADFLKHNSNLK